MNMPVILSQKDPRHRILRHASEAIDTRLQKRSEQSDPITIAIDYKTCNRLPIISATSDWRVPSC